ncbi:WXG100 family type VII secretion target [Bacillus thuringiensis]|uniref:WXG100 family type VII secretion target n=1 Tax=Bacillus thuringiensis TaxID=1428 RepID=UPI000A3CA654|nr:WXG100 family type VII secretion target [Bacillus thuringiensis]MCU4721307.1 WXG100 family type VII secretion target [Bacillus cereus]MBG9924604.1 type VII secretion protein [Bacillus thuringiensis]MDC7734727.1 WXG100 family type VII secretion target [Bacillus thuringiensis]MED3271082.1 WXG100 family type VII secretion target [Bacillus thuringiensis]OTW50681.1 type VII secretion protein [Bacillus thuringiensis serovar silo]
MGEIKVTPEELRNRAKNFKYASAEATDRHNRILSELLKLQMRWIGASSLSFYNDLPTLTKAYESFNSHLKNIEEELVRIALKFETTDNNGVNMTSGANGLSTAGLSAAGLGAGLGINNKVNLQSITDLLSTKSKEAYLYNEKSGPLYAKAIGGEVKAGAIIGGSASYNTVKVGIEGSANINGRDFKGEASLSMANAEVAAKVDKNGFEIGAEASLAKYEAGIDIPIPFTDHDLHLGGSASLGQAGGSLKVSSSGFKVNFPWGPGASPVGTGVEVEIK